MPQAGVEPAPARFLRPLPLPVGLLRPGIRSRESGSGVKDLLTPGSCPQTPNPCSGQDLNLHCRASRARASCRVGLPERHVTMDAGGNRTLIPRVQAGSLPVRRRTRDAIADFAARSSRRCGKGSNLQPPASEAGALSCLSYRNNKAVTCDWLIVTRGRSGLRPGVLPLTLSRRATAGSNATTSNQ